MLVFQKNISDNAEEFEFHLMICRTITILINQDEEELEFLTHQELRLIIKNTPNSRRKGFYILLMKDTGLRTMEELQIQKKHIDLEKRTVTIPKTKHKGQKKKKSSENNS